MILLRDKFQVLLAHIFNIFAIIAASIKKYINNLYFCTSLKRSQIVNEVEKQY